MTVLIDVTPAGNALNRWAQHRAAAARIDLDELAAKLVGGRGAHLLVVGAHPDDETLGLGRLIHRWSHSQGSVSTVVATAGEACLDHVGVRIAGLADSRMAEWAAATTILGVDDRHALGLADSSLADMQPRLYAALDEVLRRRIESADKILLATPWRRDPHPDHRVVGRAVHKLGHRYGIPVLEFGLWMTYWSDPDDVEEDGRQLLVLTTDEPDEHAFQEACAQFRSQLRPLAPGLRAVVPPAMLAHLSEQLLLLPQEKGRR